jgi:hypothetical protein
MQTHTNRPEKPGLQEPAQAPHVPGCRANALLLRLRRGRRRIQPFQQLLAGVAVFIGGFAFGHWVTNSDPAFLRILAKSERYNVRYDAAKQSIPACGGV